MRQVRARQPQIRAGDGAGSIATLRAKQRGGAAIRALLQRQARGGRGGSLLKPLMFVAIRVMAN